MIKIDSIVGRHYKILAQLGAGGMGMVFRALDQNLGREVAIKFLLEDISHNKDLAQRFLNEGRILATITHPAVVTVYASDIDEVLNCSFLVMEFFDGVSIDKRREDYQQNPLSLLRHFIELLDGIHACHQKGIIHRDIKPGNVLVNREGKLRIVDFGIAKTAQKQTRTGIAMGTPHYMSPEQCLGKGEISAKADIYSIGVMLWEFVTGHLPFDVGSGADDPALAIALMHLNEPPPLDKLQESPLGTRLRDLLSGMLAKKPEDRPAIPAIIEVLKGEAKRLQAGPEAAKPAGSPFQVGGVVNDIYHIESLLGEGGMGRVYKVRDTALNRTVALKILTDEARQDPGIIDRFVREGQLLATVGHPNVVGIFASSVEKTSGQPFLVMEYIDGVTLDTLKPTLLKNPRKVAPLMLQLLEGIAACHARGIIHRDIKPGNLYVTRDGLLKILDFGIARGNVSVTRTGMTVGTPEYMSPEQCLGDRALTGQSDIYSIGVIFWELLFGQPPFVATGPTNAAVAVAAMHIESTLPAQVLIPDQAVAPLLPIVRRMLDKNPEARPGAEELIDALEAFLENQPAEENTEETGRRKSSKSRRTAPLRTLFDDEAAGQRRNRLLTGGAGLAVLLLVAGFLWFRSPAPPPPPPPGPTLLTIPALEAEIRRAVALGEFEEAARHLVSLEYATSGGALAQAFRPVISGEFERRAREARRTGQATQALLLFEEAVRVNPVNASAALDLLAYRNELQAETARRAAEQAIRQKAGSLLAGLAPGSGTAELAATLQAMTAAGLATPAAETQAAWVDRFQREADAALPTDPARALAWLQDLQRQFPATPGLADRVKQAEAARDRIAAEAAEAARLAAQASVTQALAAEAERLVAAFAPGADPGPALALCDRLATAGEGPRADALRQRIAATFLAGIDRLATTDPAAALTLAGQAAAALPADPRFAERQKALAAAVEAARTAAGREAALQDLRAAVARKLADLHPPKPTDPIVPDLQRLETEFALPAEAATARQTLLDRYRQGAREAPDRETALRILEAALPAAPDRAAFQAELDAFREAHRAEVASAAAAAAQAKTIENKRVQALALAGNPVGKKAAALPGLLAELDRLGAATATAEVRQAARAALEAKVAAARAVTDFDPLLEAAARVFPAGSPELTGLQAKKAEFIAGRKTERVAQIRQALEKYQPGSPAKALPGLFKELDALGESQTATDLGQKLRERLTAAARAALPADPKAAQTIVREALTLPPCKGDATLKALATEAETAEKAAADKRRADLVTRIDQAIAGPGFPGQPESVVRLIADLEKEPGGAEPAKAARRQAADALLAAGRAALDGKDLAAARRHADRVKTFVPDHPGQAALAKAIADAAKPPEPPPEPPPQPPVTPPATSPVFPKPPDQPPATALEIVVTPGGSPTLAQAVAQAKPGMTIKLQPGTHQAGLTIDQAITLTGAGSREKVVLQSSGQPVLTLAGKAMVTNLTISYAGSSQTDAVKITGGSPTLKNCTVTSSAAAAPPEYSACVGVYGGNPVLQGNTMSGSRGMGLMVKGGKPLVQGNTMDGSAVYGAWFTKGAGGTFTNNTVIRSSRSGVGIKNGAAPVVKGNTVRDNKESGIFVYQGGAGTIQQNTVTGNGSFGIEVGQAGKADRIEGNTVTGNHSHGIYVHDNGSQARVGANTLAGNRGKPEHSENGGRIDRL